MEHRRWNEDIGKRKRKRLREKRAGRETERKRERKREQRTDNASGVGPSIYLSYGTHVVVLPAQPAMIKYLQHEENKGSTHVKNDLRRKRA